jgi:signal transduction histidine kinase
MDQRTKHILVAEDESNLTASLQFILSAAGYRVTMTPNGRAALAAIHRLRLEHREYDLLITDIQMPEMSGEELICALRTQAIRIPILVMTGYGEKELLIRLMRSGCQDFLEKPFEAAELEERVRLILSQTGEEALERQRKEHLALIGEKSRSLIHDLNNFLGGTLGYADMALEQIDATHPAHHKLAKLLTTVNLAADVCRKILSLRPDGPVELKSQTEIRTLVERMAVVLEAMAPDSIAIRTSAPETPVWLCADPERIQQALLNLGINAIDAMGSNGTLTFTTGIEDIPDSTGQSDRCVCITVSDTGEGIADENIAKLFCEDFTTKAHGNGLGLPTVKRIVDEHGGWIRVTSTQKHGTQFKLLFPLVRTG